MKIEDRCFVHGYTHKLLLEARKKQKDEQAVKADAINNTVSAAQSEEAKILADVLDGCPLSHPCDKLWRPEGWCKDHCRDTKPHSECWLKYAEVVANERSNRQAAVDELDECIWRRDKAIDSPEKLTDAEQRIFLVMMAREETVCKKVDEEFPEGVCLTKICKEIERKVKGALWT